MSACFATGSNKMENGKSTLEVLDYIEYITYDFKGCQIFVTGSVCPICKSSSLTTDYTGLVVIVNPAESKIAKKLNINVKGRFALKVR